MLLTISRGMVFESALLKEWVLISHSLFSRNIDRSPIVNITPSPSKKQVKEKLNPQLKQPPAVSRRHQQGGYCEICESPFADLYDHLSSKSHQHKVAGETLWSKLDVCIEKVSLCLFFLKRTAKDFLLI